MDTKLYSIMEWLFRLVCVNFLWLLFSIPIITAIPSFYAMVSIIDKWRNETDNFSTFPEFVTEFKKYFWKSYINGFLHLVIIGVFIIDFFILRSTGNENLVVVSYALLTLAILFLTITFYAIPLSIKFQLKYYKILILSIIIIMKQPIRSIISITIPIFSIALLLIQTGFGIIFLGSLTAFFMVISTNVGLKKLYGNQISIKSTVEPQSS
ncbi:DUF624 domain-containing protein [Gracilibacillus salitolerans]|uniref:DUF624 domain-containing protein n=1 Tax=Gracilibacillus salitolerans TaxID=2663022 RepID=A0A5Q2TG40_9BACI|nr:DUF624 domain-containing protein [Gracilibacillus salitolerans]QGH33626.1 DUF624 domain-containing protein [Gracilibacillus salitolerans]